MADLLECLIQIRALEETARRLQRLAAEVPEAAWRQWNTANPSPLARLAALVQGERKFAARLLAAFGTNDHAAGGGGTSATPPDSPAELAAAFTALRATTLAVLGQRSAQELAHPLPGHGAGEGTLADLVARALAADTEHLAEIQAALQANAAVPHQGA